jgi:hypothetical protein
MAKSPCLKKRHGRGECQAVGLTEGSRTRGGLPLSHNAFANINTAFFFDTIGAKKKAWQKRNARKGISPSADGDQRTRVGSAVAF